MGNSPTTMSSSQASTNAAVHPSQQPNEVIELLDDDDEEEEDRKMPAIARDGTGRLSNPIVLDDDSDDDCGDGGLPSASRKRKNEETDSLLALQLASDFGDDSFECLDGNTQHAYAKKPKTASLQQILSSDEELARRLQKEEELANAAIAAEQQKAHSNMEKQPSGKAWNFVNKVVELGRQEEAKCSKMKPVAVDDMWFLAKQMLEAQSEFAASNKPTEVDIGYHYTRDENLSQISQNGLLTKAERESRSIKSNHNGSAFGDGVYTGNNPTAFANGRYGNIGLLVARLKGNITVGRNHRRSKRKTYDTVIGGGTTGKEYCAAVVLRQSSQCIALIQFEDSLVGNPLLATRTRNPVTNEGVDRIYAVHKKLQELVDTFFNDGKRTEVEEQRFPFQPQLAGSGPAGMGPGFLASVMMNPGGPVPPAAAIPPIPPVAAATAAMGPILAGVAPSASMSQAVVFASGVGPNGGPSVPSNTLPLPNTMRLARRGRSHRSRSRRSKRARSVSSSGNIGSEVINYTAPTELQTPESALQPVTTFGTKQAEDECAVCLSPLTDDRSVVSLEGCGHAFCGECIRSALKISTKCPTCRQLVGKPQGKMPSGTMTSSLSTMSCASYPPGSIVIRYFLLGGTTRSYHDNPGVRYSGASRTAYIPNNDEGQKLLKRLKYAFSCGLTFSIGTSMTSGAPNVITWASIHHKTSVAGGAATHGFPDPSYFSNVNGELDALNVPPADEL